LDTTSQSANGVQKGSRNSSADIGRDEYLRGVAPLWLNIRRERIMKMAHIVPVPDLNLTKDNEFHMCLAHIALKNSEYKRFYTSMAAEGKHVILDNGTAEDSLVTFGNLYEMIVAIKPTEVVIPDILHDKNGSLVLADQFLNYIMRMNLETKPQFMMAVQAILWRNI
jgi:hypothetical protein